MAGSAKLMPCCGNSAFGALRAAWARAGYPIPLGGGHRAPGGVHDARAVPQRLAHAPGPDEGP
ncbi:hypothetical protein [Actinomadura mexicana]|uniref:hypothetical protein n=1 Tax=Actinomadura mexicana TaxID=134959 RepID=UPI00117785F1|nr:hypothetical protein [Actinomadura mexicana]